MHDMADSSSNDNHLPTIGLAYAHNATQSPVSEICVAYMKEVQQSLPLSIGSFITSQ